MGIINQAMGIFSRAAETIGRNRTEQRADAGTVQFDDALLEALLGNAAANKETALQIPTVSGGIDLIANIVAGTPIRLYRDDNGKAVEIKDDYRIPLLNDETGDTLNASEFWHAMIRDYYTGKGGYAYLNKVRGKLRSIHYVDESYVSIIRNTDPIFKDFSIQVDGRIYKPWEFFRILRNTKDGAEGIPITKENSRLIDVAIQQLSLEAAMAKRGGNKKGFLKAERRLDEEAMTKLKESWANLYANNKENVMILNNGLDFKECSDTSAEMQLDENKQTNAMEFAKIFHISPQAMSGSEQDVGALAKLAALPLMQVIECALNRDLLLEREKGHLYFAFDTKELLRGDMGDRADFYTKMVDANIMQIDEVRYMEDLPQLGLGFIKLGLQDVLYDPKTKIVYTPNTNQSSKIGEGALIEKKMSENTLPAVEDDGMMEPEQGLPSDPQNPEQRGDYIQNPETGLMEGSTGSGDNDSKVPSKEKENGSEQAVKEKRNYRVSEFQAKKDAKGIVETINSDPTILASKTPKEWKEAFETAGYKVKPLSKGTHKGKSFDEGGGWKANLDSERLIMYHPAEGSHHGGSYYKISDGNGGIIRYEESGKRKTD